MLWYGTVLQESPQQPSTSGVQEMTRLLYESEEFESVLIPLRDGVTVSIYRARD
jgi:predicted O-methyltransferase YrrM